MTDLIWLSAAELAEQIKDKKISPVEAVDAVLSRLDEVNPAINAFVTVTAEQAREQAKAAADRIAAGPHNLPPLFGVPVTIKDLMDTAGVRTTYGSRLFAEHVPDLDAITVRRLTDAGAISVGKTTTPEFGLLGVTESHLTGTTGTPWDPARTSGGSSGGAAAAVAAGIAPLALGSDGGGSIRVPASCCGVVGLKASTGRIPIRGNSEPDTAEGPLTRTVLDAALMLSVLAGPHDEDMLSLPSTGEDYVAAVKNAAPIGSLRIAYSPDFGQGPIDPGTRLAVEKALTAASDAGAVVETVELTLPDTLDYFVAYWGPEYLEGVAMLEGTGDDWPIMQELIAAARELTVSQASAAAHAVKVQLYNAFAAQFRRFDVIVTPTTPVPAFPHAGDKGGVDFVDGQPVRFPGIYFHRMTEPPSHAGLPAISIPAGFTAGGLPVGMQIIGPRHADAAVLAAAAAFERIIPWAGRRPLI
jgi:Asp-tRNA(Asn)/Glu-tRNA(Gln) amidotransferase A subunit family amidase